MATFDKFVSLAEKRSVGLQDLRERFIDYVRKLVVDMHQTAFGLDGVFGGTAITMSAFGADKIQLNNDATGSDGQGHFLKTDAFLAGRTAGLQFENTATIFYFVGLHFAERQRGIQINPRTSLPEFVETEETIGFRADPGPAPGQAADPSSVLNNGNGTLTFRVDSVCQPFSAAVEDHKGRRCLVWKKDPGKLATTEAQAVEELAVAFVGGQNKITTTTLLGQPASQVSTSAPEYFVLLLGPTISRTDLAVQSGWEYVGRVTGAGAGIAPSAFTPSGQNALGSGFAADINAITELLNGDLKVRVQAVIADNDTRQISAADSTGVDVFTVDEDGDVVAKGTGLFVGNLSSQGALDVVGNTALHGNATVDGAATIKGNASLGDAEADVHIMKGAFTHQTTPGVTKYERKAATGETGVGGVAVTGKQLKTYGVTELGDTETNAHTVKGSMEWRSNAAQKALLDPLAAFILTLFGKGEVKDQLKLGATQNAGSVLDAERARVDFGTLNGALLFNELVKYTGLGSVSGRLVGGVGGSLTSSEIALTLNCHFDGSSAVWVKDLLGGRPAVKLAIRIGPLDLTELTRASLVVSYRTDLNDTPWNDGSWTKEHVFDLQNNLSTLFGALKLGLNLLALADVNTARINLPHSQASLTAGTYTSLLQSLPEAFVRQGFRFYAIADNGTGGRQGLGIALNASFDNSPNLWAKDHSGKPSLLLMLNSASAGSLKTSEVELLWRDDSAGLWPESGWTSIAKVKLPDPGPPASKTVVELRDARISFTSATTDGANPPQAQGLTNTITAKNQVKAWVRFSYNPSGSVITIKDAMNISGIVVSTIAGMRGFTIALSNPLSEQGKAAVSVMGMSTSPGGRSPHDFESIEDANSSAIRVLAYSRSTGLLVDPENFGGVAELSVIILGVQI